MDVWNTTKQKKLSQFKLCFSPSFKAPAIRGTAYDLEQKLARRPSQAEVGYFHQDPNRQDPSLQPAAYALAQQLASRPSVQDAQNILA